jgi:hypothetical protein
MNRIKCATVNRDLHQILAKLARFAHKSLRISEQSRLKRKVIIAISQLSRIMGLSLWNEAIWVNFCW